MEINSNIEKIKNILKNSKNIALFLEDNPPPDVIGASLAMFFALKKFNKNVLLANPTPLPVLNVLIKKMTKEKLVLIFEDDASEIFYEKNSGQTKIYLTPKNNPIRPNSFSCQVSKVKEDQLTNESAPFDLLISLGINKYEIIENKLTEQIDCLSQCDILNISNDANNQNYGDINFILPNRSLSEIIAQLIYKLGNEFMNKKTADALIYGLFNCEDGSPSNSILETFLWLLKNNGRFDLLINENEPQKESQLKILEHALLNLDQELFEKTKIGLSSVEEKFFLATSNHPKDLLYTIEKAKNFFLFPAFILLWNSSKETNGVFWSNDASLVSIIQNNFPGQYKDTGGLFVIRNSDINQAKEKIKALLP